MSDSYTKLFSSITASTIVSEPLATRWLWVTMLAMSDASGHVWGSIPGLARIANITLEQCEEALTCFLSPDPYSRTKENDGRRVAEVDGGWLLLNHGKYRAIRSAEERREYMRVYMQNKRDKEKKEAESLTESLAMLALSTEVTPPAPAPDKSLKACASSADEAPTRSDPIPYQRIADLYNQTMKLLPKVAKVNASRKTLIRNAWQDGEERKNLEFWTAYFEECEASNFLNGKGPYTNGHENWRPDFDYLMQGKTILRTYEKALTRMEQEQ